MLYHTSLVLSTSHRRVCIYNYNSDEGVEYISTRRNAQLSMINRDRHVPQTPMTFTFSVRSLNDPGVFATINAVRDKPCVICEINRRQINRTVIAESNTTIR